MCGTNGFYNYSNQNLKDGQLLIGNMNHSIAHRGPNDDRIWLDNSKGIYLGQGRLSIIDFSSSGHQPMIREYGNVIVLNGEIYNYKELKPLLKKRTFKSTSDTEVLLYLYEKFDENCPDLLNGMYAFSMWDDSKKQLFISRDRAVKKLFYYTCKNNIFAFSSEIKALPTLPWVNVEINHETLYHSLIFNFFPPPLTLFKDSYKLPPASKMKVDNTDSIKIESYWEITYSDLSDKSEDELEELILSGIEKSMDYRMESDVPVGAFLSGGVNSSTIVALMNERASYPIKTYSIGFENALGYNGQEFAVKAAKIYCTDHYEKIVTPQNIVNFLPKIVEIFDEPLAYTRCIPLYFISQLARENGTIAGLISDGPDELFLGYRNWMK